MAPTYTGGVGSEPSGDTWLAGASSSARPQAAQRSRSRSALTSTPTSHGPSASPPSSRVATVNYFGVQKTATAARMIVAFVLASLAAVVFAVLFGGEADAGHLTPVYDADLGPDGVLQAAGLLFFAFAGYARIATLGEEVRDPATTIPRAIPIALGIALAVYFIVAAAALAALGTEALADADAPLVDAVKAAGAGRPGAVRPRGGGRGLARSLAVAARGSEPDASSRCRPTVTFPGRWIMSTRVTGCRTTPN